jgi:hypothetical protein
MGAADNAALAAGVETANGIIDHGADSSVEHVAHVHVAQQGAMDRDRRIERLPEL